MEITKTVYHGTSFSRAQAILRVGLIPSSMQQEERKPQPGQSNKDIPMAELQKQSAFFGLVRARRDNDDYAVVFQMQLPVSTLRIPDRFGNLPTPSQGKYWRYYGGRISPNELDIAAFYNRHLAIRHHRDGPKKIWVSHKVVKPEEHERLVARLRSEI